MTVNKKWVVLGLISFYPLIVWSAGFTKPKTPSTNQLKDLCAQGAGDTLKQIPELLQNVAKIQSSMVVLLEDLIDGNPQGFCAKATKLQLEDRQQKIQELNNKMADFNQEMRKSIKELQ